MDGIKVLKGKITRLIKDTVSTEVHIEIDSGESITSIITTASAERLGLTEGQAVNAVIKATSVMIETE